MRKLRLILKLLVALTLGLAGAALLHSYVLDGPRVFSVTPERSTPKAEIQFAAAPVGVTAEVTGRVGTSMGIPIAGAMVTGTSTDSHRRVTIFSDGTGAYRLQLPFAGEVRVRARVPGFADVEEMRTVADGGSLSLDFALAALVTPRAFSDQLTASAHAATLEWEEAPMREAFVSQCHYCHQIGNSLTRRPRKHEEWFEVVERMEGYMALVTTEQKHAIADSLFGSFTGDPIAALQTHDLSADLYGARIEEWTVGNPLSFIHDAEVGADGRLYGVDQAHDLIWTLDRATGEVASIALPEPEGLPVGGLFSGLALPIGIFTGKIGPHSLAEGPDGRFWITGALSSALLSYDPETGEVASYAIDGDSLYPHTVRVDGQGVVWFTIAASNQVGRFDPETSTFTILDLPSVTLDAWIADAMFPTILKIASWFPGENRHLDLSHHDWSGAGRFVMNLPYGIDVNPKDGSIWYAKLYGNRIGRIDPGTLEITEYETPEPGPRRPRFDSQGALWIPAFDAGKVLRFDPQTEDFTVFALPTLAPGEYETPYALNVDRESGAVWITSNLSDRIFRFDPDVDRFVSYPSPTRVTYLRDLSFTSDGQVCSAHSNLPAYAIEGGVPAFVCLAPAGNASR